MGRVLAMTTESFRCIPNALFFSFFSPKSWRKMSLIRNYSERLNVAIGLCSPSDIRTLPHDVYVWSGILAEWMVGLFMYLSHFLFSLLGLGFELHPIFVLQYLTYSRTAKSMVIVIIYYMSPSCCTLVPYLPAYLPLLFIVYQPLYVVSISSQ